MKKAVLVMLVVAFIGFSVVAAWAGPAEDTGRKWVERAFASPNISAKGINPEVVALYYVDLMSNSGSWQSFLVVTNWDLDTRIRIVTSFIPTDGTPSDIITREHYISPNAVLYLDQYGMGFGSRKTNWFGIVVADTTDYWTCGVLLYSSEYGLAWIPADGPYFP